MAVHAPRIVERWRMSSDDGRSSGLSVTVFCRLPITPSQDVRIPLLADDPRPTRSQLPNPTTTCGRAEASTRLRLCPCCARCGCRGHPTIGTSTPRAVVR